VFRVLLAELVFLFPALEERTPGEVLVTREPIADVDVGGRALPEDLVELSGEERERKRRPRRLPRSRLGG